MQCIVQRYQIKSLKQKVIIKDMRSIIISPENEKEFDFAITLITTVAKDQKPVAWNSDEGGYTFLKKVVDKAKIVVATP